MALDLQGHLVGAKIERQWKQRYSVIYIFIIDNKTLHVSLIHSIEYEENVHKNKVIAKANSIM